MSIAKAMRNCKLCGGSIDKYLSDDGYHWCSNCQSEHHKEVGLSCYCEMCM